MLRGCSYPGQSGLAHDEEFLVRGEMTKAQIWNCDSGVRLKNAFHLQALGEFHRLTAFDEGTYAFRDSIDKEEGEKEAKDSHMPLLNYISRYVTTFCLRSVVIFYIW